MTSDARSTEGNSASDRERIAKIVSYWDSALLSSRVSSTSRADPCLAALDNAIENRVLLNILASHSQGQRRCIDVGAGYGRFVPALQRHYSEIVLLEGAVRIYNDLVSFWGGEKGIECILSDFESFEDRRECDSVLASGILYLYDDQMVHGFLAKCRSMLRSQGLCILRDFVAIPAKVVPSGYVQGGQCHYRTPTFWADTAKENGFELLEVRRSKPALTFLRNRRLLKLLRLMRVADLMSRPFGVTAAMRLGHWGLSDRATQTVFIVMRVL